MIDWQILIVIPIIAWSASFIAYRSYLRVRSSLQLPWSAAAIPNQVQQDVPRPHFTSPCQSCAGGCQTWASTCQPRRTLPTSVASSLPSAENTLYELHTHVDR